MFILIFTNIGQGNQQIRRMRSAFDKKDASSNVRDINKAAIAKYMDEAPWGIGIGMLTKDIPANNKFNRLSRIPPDSEYVYIWVRTGIVGVTVFTCCMVLILIGGCLIVLFRLKSPSLTVSHLAFFFENVLDDTLSVIIYHIYKLDPVLK